MLTTAIALLFFLSSSTPFLPCLLFWLTYFFASPHSNSFAHFLNPFLFSPTPPPISPHSSLFILFHRHPTHSHSPPKQVGQDYPVKSLSPEELVVLNHLVDFGFILRRTRADGTPASRFYPSRWVRVYFYVVLYSNNAVYFMLYCIRTMQCILCCIVFEQCSVFLCCIVFEQCSVFYVVLYSNNAVYFMLCCIRTMQCIFMLCYIRTMPQLAMRSHLIVLFFFQFAVLFYCCIDLFRLTCIAYHAYTNMRSFLLLFFLLLCLPLPIQSITFTSVACHLVDGFKATSSVDSHLSPTSTSTSALGAHAAAAGASQPYHSQLWSSSIQPSEKAAAVGVQSRIANLSHFEAIVQTNFQVKRKRFLPASFHFLFHDTIELSLFNSFFFRTRQENT